VHNGACISSIKTVWEEREEGSLSLIEGAGREVGLALGKRRMRMGDLEVPFLHLISG